jgi:hypothetical protein
VDLADIHVDPRDVDRQLLPLLRTGGAPARAELVTWTARMVADCRDLLASAVLPLRSEEVEFLDRLNDRGEIAAELLTTDAEVRGRIREHPGLLWKARNVREHKGLGSGGGAR